MRKRKLSIQNFIWLLCCAFFCVMAGILFLWRNSIVSHQVSQQMAQRWNPSGGVSQISCFFSGYNEVSEDTFRNFEHALDNALKEASITVESENAGARLWVDAYSAPGMITVTSERTSLSLKAIGIGGDFFQFHPQKLLYGSYFSGNDLNQDYILIDEETAWQLYGANDIAGKIVSINGIPHMICGVIKRPQEKLDQEAGLGEPIIYTSYSTLVNHGTTNGINHYEIVMPNPIDGFAMKMVKENLGADERETEFIENTDRYSLVSSLKLVGKFGIRSMNGKAIIYPYWENLARGYEDIVALITLIVLLLLLFPAVTAFVWLIYRWRHKSWTVKSIAMKFLDILRIQKEKYYAGKSARRRKKEEDDDYEEK